MKLLSICICLAIATPLFSQSKKELQTEITNLKAQVDQLKKPKEVDLNDKHKQASYALGVVIGTNIKSQHLDSLHSEALLTGMQDVLSNGTLKMESNECASVVQQYMQLAAENKSKKSQEESQVFLEQNKTKEGIKVTASGLQYKVITEGKGNSPGANDNVTVHYTGKLLDGTVFDSSVERGEPISLGVSQVIPGWTEALQLMKEGDKWILFIPYNLAYGERGAGGQIPPYAALIFEVELIKIN